MYIARDKDGEAWLFDNKPVLDDKINYYIQSEECYGSCKLSKFESEDLKALFGIENLTFENSPIEIEVTIKTK